MQNSLNDYNDRLSGIENRITDVNADIDKLSDSLEEIRNDVAILDEQIDTGLNLIQSDFLKLQESMSDLQDNIVSIRNQGWHKANHIYGKPGSGEKSYVTDLFELSGGGTRVRFYFRGINPSSEIIIWMVFSNGTKLTHRGSSGYWGSYSTLVSGTPEGEYYLIIETEDITAFNVFVWDYYDENMFTPTYSSTDHVTLQPSNPYNTIIPYSEQSIIFDGYLNLDNEYNDSVWFVIETPNYDVDCYMQYNDGDLVIGINIPAIIRYGSQIALYFDLDDNGAMQSGIDLAILWHGDPHGGPYAGWLSNPLEDARARASGGLQEGSSNS